LLYACILFVPLLAQQARAGSIVAFDTPQTFFGAVQIVTTETFDEFAPDTLLGIGEFHLNGITYTSVDPAARWITNDSFVTPSAPNALVQQNTNAPATLAVESGIATTGIGFFLVGLGGIPIVTFRIDVVGADGERFTETFTAGPTTTTLYRGFASQAGIVSVAISPIDIGNGTGNFRFDNVSLGAPIPSGQPINTCPTVISSPGRYLLGADLTCRGGDGITINSSDVTLALEGHRITAGMGANFAIATGSRGPVEHVRILGPGLITNGGANTFLRGVSFIGANSSEVSGITVLGSSGAGITAGSGDFMTITANTLGRNNHGIDVFTVHFSTISENDASGNIVGMSVDNVEPPTAPLGTVSHNIFNGNTNTGLALNNFRGATVQNNVTNGNGVNGIAVFSGTSANEITNNTSLANGGFDLSDNNSPPPPCSTNVWSGNKFFTANQSCIH
jgi:hypothetical protein